MPSDAYSILMDVSNFTSGAQKVGAGLALLDGKFNDVSNATVKFNNAGKQIAKTFTGMTDAGEKLSLSINKIGKNWGVTAASMTTGMKAAADLKADLKKFNADMDRLEKERIAAAKANAQQGAAIGQLGRNVAGTRAGAAAGGILAPSLSTLGVGTKPGTATSGELFSQAKAVASVQAFAAANRISAATINRVWTDVGNNSFKAYTGRMGELQTKLFAVQQATLAVGTANAEATRQSKGFLLSWESIARFFEARILYNAINQIAGAITGGIERATEFQQVLGRITTLAPALSGGYKDWGESVKRVAKTFGVDATDAAKSYYSALSNQIGNSISEIEAFTRTTAEFARTTGATAEQANNLFSSTINAFGVAAGDANLIAAKFFKAIDLGRITAGGLSDTFGRVAVAANTIGFSLNETLGALAVLTQKGVSEADAMTQVLNITNKLLKPTDAMKVAIESWGYASGQALVQNEGLIGVLVRLQAEIDKGGLSLVAKELGDIRAIRGGLGLTGDSLAKMIEYTKQIGSAQVEYNKAIKDVTLTDGQKWAKQLNEVKTAFTELGERGLSVLVFLTDNLNGLVGSFKAVVAIATTFGSLLLGFKYGRDAFAAISLAIEAISLKTVKWTVTLAGLRAAWTAFSTTVLTSTALMTGGISLLVGGLASWLLLAESNSGKFNRLLSEGLEATRVVTKQVLEDISSRYDRLTASMEKASKAVFSNAATIRSSYTKSINEIDNGFADLKQTLSDFEKETFNSLSDKIRVITDEISSLKNESKNLNDEINKAFKIEAVEDFRSKIEKLSSGKQARSIEAEIARLAKDAKRLSELALTEADPAKQTAFKLQAEEQRKIAISLTSDLKAAAKESIKAKEQADRDVERFSKKNVERAQEEIRLQREITTASNEKAANRGRNKDESRDDANRRQLLAESRLQDAQDALNRFRAEGAKAIVDQKNASLEVYDIHKGLAKLQVQITDSLKNQDELVNKRLDLLKDEKKLLEDKKIPLTRVFTEISELMTSRDVGTFEEVTAKVTALREQYTALMSPEINPSAFIQLLTYTDKILERAKSAKALEDLDKSTLDTQKKLDESKKTINDLKNKENALAQKRGEITADAAARVATLPVLTGKTEIGIAYNDAKTELVKLLEKAKVLPDTLDTSIVRIRELAQIIRETRIDNTDIFTESGITSISDFEITISALSRTASGIRDIESEYIKLIAAQEKALANMRAIPTGTSVPRQAGGGFAHFAGGGSAYGSDSIRSLLSPGEFVVNAGASRKFASQLIAMNSGTRNFAGGGSTTNVGDINVNMQSGGNASTDVVKIGKLLRREIKRGTVRL